MKNLYKAHPWHGVPIGAEAPAIVNAYIEIVPTDTVKYEIDKETGHLKVDRPQKYSNCCPTLYGFIPQTYCGSRVGARGTTATGKPNLFGDRDPLDICILTDRAITHGDIFVRAIPIGGLRVLDKGEVDDKIIAVLQDDLMYGEWRELAECPKTIIDRLSHYFLTYKHIPSDKENTIVISGMYGSSEAKEIIRLSGEDYEELIRTDPLR